MIREVQRYLCCELAPGLSKDELHRAEERYKALATKQLTLTLLYYNSYLYNITNITLNYYY